MKFLEHYILGNLLFYILVIFGGLALYHGAAGRQQGSMQYASKHRSYAPTGYYDRVDSLIALGYLQISADDQSVTVDTSNGKVQRFLQRSFLRADLGRFENGRRDIFEFEPSGDSLRLKSYNRDFRRTVLADRTWKGTLSYRYPTKPSAMLWNSTDRLLIRLRPPQLLRVDGRLRPGGAQVPASLYKTWDLVRSRISSNGSVLSAYAWNVALGGETFLQGVGFYGMEDVVAKIRGGVADSLSLNDQPVEKLLERSSGGTVQTRTLRLEDHDVLTFNRGGHQEYLVFSRLPTAQPNPFTTLSTVAHTWTGTKRTFDKQAGLLGQGVVRAMDDITLRDGLRSSLATRDIQLSLDRIIEERLNKLLIRYLIETYPKQYSHMHVAMTVLDASNGEIVALPSYPQRYAGEPSPNWNLIRHNVGSAGKVPLYAAALSLHPTLLNLVFSFSHNSKSSFSPRRDFVKKHGHLDHKVRVLGSDVGTFEEVTPLSLPEVDFEAAIKYSSNVYAVAVALLATMDDDSTNPFCKAMDSGHLLFSDGSRLGKLAFLNYHPYFSPHGEVGHLERSPLAIRLASVFDLERQLVSNSYDTSVWAPLSEELGGHSSLSQSSIEELFDRLGVSPELSNMGLDLVIDRESLRNEFITWVLGHGNNFWSDVKLAEAYARTITRRRVRATFTPVTTTPPDIKVLTDIPDSQYKRFLNALRLPLQPQTTEGRPTAWALSRIQEEFSTRGITMYAKTGSAYRQNRGLLVCYLDLPSRPRSKFVVVFDIQGPSIQSSHAAVFLARSVLEELVELLTFAEVDTK